MKNVFVILLLASFTSALFCQKEKIEFDGVYVIDKTGMTTKLYPNPAKTAHYVSKMLVPFYRSPQRAFSLSDSVLVVGSFGHLVLKGPQFSSETLQKLAIGEFKKIELGFPFFSDGYNVYEDGTAMIHLPESDHKLENIINLKSLDTFTTEVFLKKSLDSNVTYGILVNDNFYFLRIR